MGKNSGLSYVTAGCEMADNSVHIVGGGLAGLSAATLLIERGYRVRLYESTGHAGGRCRSFHDDQLGCVIDNGNHLMLSGNRSTQDYIGRIGAENRLVTSERAAFPFMDIESGERWALDLGKGAGVWRLLLQHHRDRHGSRCAYGIPGVARLDALGAFRFRHPPENATVHDQSGNAGAIYRRLWEPLSVAVLNTEPTRAMAGAMWPVLKETLGCGPDACRPVMAKEGLSHALVEPALGYLQQAGADVRFNTVLKAVEFGDSGISSLKFTDQTVNIDAGDRVILALPIAAINTVLPDLVTPNEFSPIVNAHFKTIFETDKLTLMGLINGNAHWIFRRNNIVSVTVSAAASLMEESAEHIAAILWRDVSVAIEVDEGVMGASRIIKEKRATFAQTPEQNRRRPTARTTYNNVFLAGDWIATGLPATIEGAIRSGTIAADLCYK